MRPHAPHPHPLPPPHPLYTHITFSVGASISASLIGTALAWDHMLLYTPLYSGCPHGVHAPPRSLADASRKKTHAIVFVLLHTSDLSY